MTNISGYTNIRLKKGIALFYALIIISLVLAVGLTVFSLISGGLPLAEIIKNSQKAFFAADAGVECVLYWDIKHPNNLDGETDFVNGGSSIYCNKQEIPLNEFFNDAHFTEYHFDFTLSLDNDVCVDVSVSKNSPGLKTAIKSSGHSPCQAGARNRVERTLEVSYE